MTRKCKHCDEPVKQPAMGRPKLYCNNACRTASARLRRLGPIPLGLCRYCGVQFTPARRGNGFCDADCQRQYYLAQDRGVTDENMPKDARRRWGPRVVWFGDGPRLIN